MVNVSLVVCLSSSFSGLFDGTGLLDGVRGLVEGLARRVSPYAAVLAVSVPASMVACNQTLGIMLTSQLCGHAEAGGARPRDRHRGRRRGGGAAGAVVDRVRRGRLDVRCAGSVLVRRLLPMAHSNLAIDPGGGGEGARSAEAAENSSRAHA